MANKKRSDRSQYALTISIETKIRFRVISQAKGLSQSELFTEMVDNAWESMAKEKVIDKVERRKIINTIKRIIARESSK